ncbi:hypothetical protein ACIBJE_01975 [Micromonospora sp. NPDC050187]|uniref:hypothetical protein n=1 Tax=Micromonospora sp. NPDC050187 TaxID=3364277 RepID=UPI0037B02916
MHIIPDARPCAHITLPPRLAAGYVGPASGLRTALLTGAAVGRPARTATALTAGGVR